MRFHALNEREIANDNLVLCADSARWNVIPKPKYYGNEKSRVRATGLTVYHKIIIKLSCVVTIRETICNIFVFLFHSRQNYFVKRLST